MFEARLNEAELLKKGPSGQVIDAVKEVVNEASFEVSDEGMALQAMDSSHVALISLKLDASGFEEGYRCDRNMMLHIAVDSFVKVLKTAGHDDTITFRADESTDVLDFLIESKKKDRICEFSLKLMEYEVEHLGIPSTTYDANVTFAAAEYARLIRELKEVGEAVRIDVGKEGVRFEASGDVGKAAVTLRAAKSLKMAISDAESDESDDDEEMEDVKHKAIEIDTDDEKPVKDKAKKGAGKSNKNKKDDTKSKKDTKKKDSGKKKDDKKKSKKKLSDDYKDVVVEMSSAVSLTFALKYLSQFAKAAPLSDKVCLRLSADVPLMVEFEFEGGHIRCYLAPKIEDD